MKRNRHYNKGFNKLLILFTILIFSASISVTSIVFADNKNTEDMYRYYTSICIKPGDSLWNIACEYSSGSGLTVNEYIDELKAINHLTGTEITSGQYLLVIYFSNEYK